MSGEREADLRLLECGRCREARFCCDEHLKQDWKRHKAACNFIKASKG